MASPSTSNVDVLVATDGLTASLASILTTKATCNVADTPVPAVFATTRIAVGSLVVIRCTAGDGAADLGGHFVMRPLLGAERLKASRDDPDSVDMRTIDGQIEVSKNHPAEHALHVVPLFRESVAGADRLWSFVADVNYEAVSLEASWRA